MKKFLLVIFLIFTTILVVNSYENEVRREFTPNYKYGYKNAIFDSKITTLGSTNWTSTAELVNDENMLIVYDKKIAKRVEKNFQKMWNSIPDKWLYMTPKYRNQLKK